MKLIVRNLRKEYTSGPNHHFTVLDNLNLTVEDGEFLSLLGPSGCGKSTLLEIIAGLQTHSSGEIIINNQEPGKNAAKPAIVFQHYGLFPWLTVQQNIEYGLKIRGIDRKTRNKIALDHIRMMHLNGFAKFYPHELSGGMQQRVALARALANNPDILLLDEPFAALDAQTRESCQRELLNLWQQTRVTILFVTHDVGEAIFLSDRVVVMSKEPGSVKDLIPINIPRPRDLSVRIAEEFRRTEMRIRLMISESSNQTTTVQNEVPHAG
ncbi:ABC transporter ATP-binding protein [Desulfotignum phosphitoxidans]|uniref:Putative sulfonate transporter ATPase n=2 Tax=Desulfotignum phosphitoxidans TaxID=190898 RepID=S0FSA7_9BACT|nr:ABC transporter ATP-binding protein [Desulfotignum phosphitoxidans]ADB92527.1 putative sulfonate transporter ATPase [Desulfotignum phosphitoxidans DSM 13687]EMS77968.1 putative sulfonate transporter ATPase [Desulfotignum phosphitoxidans DSM 13687]